MKAFLTFLMMYFGLILYAQQAPDFTITDSDGVVHHLYADHLDQGQTVVIELFFIACPPCQSLAPWMEERYQQWGAGQYDVEFIGLSIQIGDTNAEVADYKTQYGIEFPMAGGDGGAKDAATIYQSGTFGPYFGTPSLIVIAPDGTVNQGFATGDLNDAIAATGATGGSSIEPPTTISIVQNIASQAVPDDIKYYLKPANANTPKYDILDLNNGSLVFDYPSDIFPEIVDPVITVEATGPANAKVRPSDLVLITKHILELQPLQGEAALLAADVNSDGKIRPSDLVDIRKVILELEDGFPNGTPSWKSIPQQIPLPSDPGQQVDINFTLVKMGDVGGN